MTKRNSSGLPLGGTDLSGVEWLGPQYICTYFYPSLFSEVSLARVRKYFTRNTYVPDATWCRQTHRRIQGGGQTGQLLPQTP